MAAAWAVARRPEAEARRPPSFRAARLLLLLAAVAAVGPREGGAARLYRVGVDAVWLLDSGSVRSATGNSSAAWLVQFHSSWCGHCIGYAPTWRALAADVRGEGPAPADVPPAQQLCGSQPPRGPMALPEVASSQNADFILSPASYVGPSLASLDLPRPQQLHFRACHLLHSGRVPVPVKPQPGLLGNRPYGGLRAEKLRNPDTLGTALQKQKVCKASSCWASRSLTIAFEKSCLS